MLRDLQNIQHEMDGDDLHFAIKDSAAYKNLIDLQEKVNEIVNDVVKFEHGGLNNSVDTMTEVVKSYYHGREDIRVLRKSLAETQSVLTSKKMGQIPLRELWLKKAEMEESLRIMKDVDYIKV